MAGFRKDGDEIWLDVYISQKPAAIKFKAGMVKS